MPAAPTPAPTPAEHVLSVQVVTPSATVWSGDADLVTVPSASGSLGILPRRAPVAAVLVAGVVRVRPTTGEAQELAISGGFVVADDDEVTVLADRVVTGPPTA